MGDCKALRRIMIVCQAQVDSKFVWQTAPTDCHYPFEIMGEVVGADLL